MRKTTFKASVTQAMVDDFAKLEKQLRDMRSILTLIALKQEDHTLHVPIEELQDLPQGSTLEISYDPVHENYVFKAILADDVKPEVFAEEIPGTRTYIDPVVRQAYEDLVNGDSPGAEGRHPKPYPY